MELDDMENLDGETIPDEEEEVEATRTTAPQLHELKPSEQKALLELRSMIEESISSGHLIKPSSPPAHHHRRHSRREKSNWSRVSSSFSSDFSFDNLAEETAEHDAGGGGEDLTDISLWGIPLSPSKNHEGTDVILLKFLQARDFKPAEAHEMLRRTLRWRRQFKVEDAAAGGGTVEHLKKAAYVDGRDREGNPVFYNISGVFKDKEVYRKTFDTPESRAKFLRWRVSLMEEGVKKLNLRPGGAASMLNVVDLKDLRPGMKELRSATRDTVSILQDNYPECVAKNILLNVSFRYYAYHAMFSPFISQRTKSKFIFCRPAKVTETLLKFIAPENIPVRFGGMKRDDDEEFDEENRTPTEMNIKANSMCSIEFPTPQVGLTVVWDIMVVGGEMNYKEEFIPEDEGSYNVLLKKEKKLEECSRNSYYISEPGKLHITFDNRNYKRKRIFYRSKTKATVPIYNGAGGSGKEQKPPAPAP